MKDQTILIDEKTPNHRMKQARISLRDYFAANALQAIIAQLPIKIVLESDNKGDEEIKKLKATKIPGVVAGAYAYADEMLKQRNQRTEGTVK